MTQNSAMSITQLVNASSSDNIDIEDPDVKIAAEALGDMARLGRMTLPPPLSTPSTTPSSPLPTPTSSSFTERLSFSSESTLDEETYQQRSHFIHRVSNIPIVNSALKAYESSKNSSSVVKYGAEMVESIAAPIYGKFGKGVDEWGCKQLDRLEERYPTYVTPKEETDDDDASSTTFALSRVLLEDNNSEHGGLRKRRDSRDERNVFLSNHDSLYYFPNLIINRHAKKQIKKLFSFYITSSTQRYLKTYFPS